MNKKELDFILQEGEDVSNFDIFDYLLKITEHISCNYIYIDDGCMKCLKIEFKESLKNIDKEIVAFSNALGGRIFLGIGDDNKVKGIGMTNKLKSQIQDIANNCDPAVKISLVKFGRVLIINVEEGQNKPYRCSSGFYMRQGPNSQKMKTRDIKEMILSQGKVKFDNQATEFDFKDFDKEAFANYLKKAGIASTASRKDILFNLGILKEGKLNNTGILFFSKLPKKYFINAYVTCARYKGTEKVKVIDRKDMEANLVNQVENSIKFIERNTMLEYEIKGLERKEIPEYPVEALREAILNAVMHRDYFETGANVQIDIFDDKITVTNIGGLIKPLTKEKLGKMAVRRNPLIADLFHRVHLVERMGTGIKRIRQECLKHGNVKFEIETNGYFIATFRLLKRVGEKLGEKLGENQINILKLINENKFISIPELSKMLKISSTAVENNLAKLKKKGLLKRIGPDRGGHWEIIR